MVYKRTDDNQTELVKLARSMGASVAVTSAVGKGFPDIIIGFRGKNYMVEIKDGAKIPSLQKLTPDEIEFHNKWNGSINVIKNKEELINLLNS